MQTIHPTKLLGDLLRHEPDTREGQWRVAEHIKELVGRHNLGVCEIFEFAETPDGSGGKYPFVKIISEFGVSVPRSSGGLMTWSGHFDTVPKKGKQMHSDALTIIQGTDKRGDIGKGRGTLDMISGVVAKLSALEIAHNTGGARRVIQTILSSREELGSEVLFQAIKAGKVEKAPVGATTEIRVQDDGQPSPLYRGRRGRIGINTRFTGVNMHSGAADDDDLEVLDGTAHRYLARALDEMMDSERGFFIDNQHPDDAEGILGRRSIAKPGEIAGKPEGLSLVDAIDQSFDIFTTDPNIAPEWVLSQLREYLLKCAKRPEHDLKVWLEERHGVPFIPPYLTPADSALVKVAEKHAVEIRGETAPVVGAKGVAEEGMIADLLGTRYIGWSPDGEGAHEEGEYVYLDSIPERAEWLAKFVSYDGDL